MRRGAWASGSAERGRVVGKGAQQRRQQAQPHAPTQHYQATAMEAMQGDWDAAVAANAEELTGLRASASAASQKQAEETAALERLRREMAEQGKAIGALSAERRSLAQEEATLRERYAAS